MEYYTNYRLTIDSFPGVFEKIKDYAIQSGISWDLAGFFEELQEDSDYRWHSKWYDYEKDMLSLSRAFPEVLFTLEGAGEECGDLWKAYYLGGKVQAAPAKIS